jgi:hypothetical protein
MEMLYYKPVDGRPQDNAPVVFGMGSKEGRYLSSLSWAGGGGGRNTSVRDSNDIWRAVAIRPTIHETFQSEHKI